MGQHCTIEVGNLGEHLYIRVNGYASFQEAAEITHYLDLLDEAESPSGYTFDLCSCEKMDSSFMGLMARLSAASTDGRIDVVRCGGTSLQCLQDLGLTEIVNMKDQPEGEPTDFRCLDGNAPARQMKERVIRDSHKSLSELNDKNKETFKGVIDALGQDSEDQ